MQKIVVLTGAGISAESGLSTFRAEGGLWAQHAIEDVDAEQILDDRADVDTLEELKPPARDEVTEITNALADAGISIFAISAADIALHDLGAYDPLRLCRISGQAPCRPGFFCPRFGRFPLEWARHHERAEPHHRILCQVEAALVSGPAFDYPHLG